MINRVVVIMAMVAKGNENALSKRDIRIAIAMTPDPISAASTRCRIRRREQMVAVVKLMDTAPTNNHDTAKGTTVRIKFSWETECSWLIAPRNGNNASSVKSPASVTERMMIDPRVLPDLFIILYLLSTGDPPSQCWFRSRARLACSWSLHQESSLTHLAPNHPNESSATRAHDRVE